VCLLWVIYFGGSLCYSGPFLSSLALVCVFGLLWCLGCFEGACPIELSLFLFDLIDVCTAAYHVICLTYCVLVPVGRLLFLRDRELVTSCNIV